VFNENCEAPGSGAIGKHIVSDASVHNATSAIACADLIPGFGRFKASLHVIVYIKNSVQDEDRVALSFAS
jgi:hypothetical protein